MPGIAPSNTKSSARVLPQRSLITWFLPPIGLALPCSTLAVVSAAGEIAVDVDVGRDRARPRMPVIELTVVPPSLIASLAMCEWQSMMPGRDELAGGVDDLGAGGDRRRSRRPRRSCRRAGRWCRWGSCPVTVRMVPPRSATRPDGRATCPVRCAFATGRTAPIAATKNVQKGRVRRLTTTSCAARDDRKREL